MLLTGCATSLPQATLPPALSTSEALTTSAPQTLSASRSAISSPASASGATRFVPPAGQTIDLFGPVPVRANLSARQAKALGLLTSGTSGRPGTTSSASAVLQSSLESRLQVLTAGLGSTLFKMTWRPWVTPSGRCRSRLRASVLRTSGTGCTSWPTPSAQEFGALDVERMEARRAECKARTGNGNGFGLTLAQAVVSLASWATPTTRDWHSASGSEEFLAGRLEQTRGKPLSEQAFTLASWATPNASDHKGAATPEAVKEWEKRGHNLPEQALMTGPARRTASGSLLIGSSAGMDGGGQLNPEHSRWLQGLSAVWGSCAPTATRSARRPQQRSSQRPSAEGSN